MPVVNVVAYGAKHDGGTDDTAAIARAMGAAVSTAKGVYVPAGTYHVSSITVPVGLAVYGAGMRQAWLKGHVELGSNQTLTDVKIRLASAGVSAIHNVAGADTTSFTRCHFRGGGGTYGDNTDYATVAIGHGRNVSHLTFTDCEFERSLGTQWQGSDAAEVARENTVDVYAICCTIDTVAFDGCKFGVSNGVATGAQRMMVECGTAHGSANSWRNLTFRDCEFYPSNAQNLDRACCTDSGRADGVLVEGCTFHGAGVRYARGYAICLEWPANVTIRNNYFHRCREGAVYPGGDFMGTNTDTHWSITGNTFEWDTAEQSIPVARGIVCLCSANNVVTGNTFDCHTMLPPGGASPGWDGCVEMGTADARGNIVTGNRLYLANGVNVYCEYSGATGNTITPNTVVYP